MRSKATTQRSKSEDPKGKALRQQGKSRGSEKKRKAVNFYTSGIWPSIAYGVEQYGLSPTDLKQPRATAAACAGVGGCQSCPVTTVEIGMGQHKTLAIQARLCIFSWWLRLWARNTDMRQPVQKAWRRVHYKLRGAKSRWGLVRGPMSSVVATLLDLGWIPCEPDTWKSPTGDWWEFMGGTFAHILDAIYLCVASMEEGKVSMHVDEGGREHGVDMRGFHKQHDWLTRKGLHRKAGLTKEAAASGLWPAARRRAADGHC